MLERIRSRPVVLRRRRIYAFELGNPVPVVESPLTLRFEIKPETARAFETQSAMGSSELRLVAFSGAETVYRMRMALRREEVLRLLRGCSVPARPIFFYDCFTHPDFRGKAAYPASLTHALRFARDSGFETAFIRVEQSNLASARGIERAGFRPAAVILHVAIFGFPLGPFGKQAHWATIPSSRGRQR